MEERPAEIKEEDEDDWSEDDSTDDFPFQRDNARHTCKSGSKIINSTESSMIGISRAMSNKQGQKRVSQLQRMQSDKKDVSRLFDGIFNDWMSA